LGLNLFGKDKMSFSKKVKDGVKKAVAFVNDFETTAAELAIEKNMIMWYVVTFTCLK
jgi:hypothetical protein